MRNSLALIAVLVAAATLPLPLARAADVEAADKGAAATGSEPDVRQDRRAPPERKSDDLTTCKRDADGMRGPERSRFMTRCLKERK